MKLTIELVPQTSWGDNLRSRLKDSSWKKLQVESLLRAQGKCEICMKPSPLECHEIWNYDDENKIQKLKGLIALCPGCHEVKHIGRAFLMPSRGKKAVKHLANINDWSYLVAEEYVSSCFELWRKRSQDSWELDLKWLKSKNAEFKKVYNAGKITESKLDKAVRLNDEKNALKIILNSSQCESFFDQKGNNVIHRAVEQQNVKIVSALLNSPNFSALINQGNNFSVTPLIRACQMGNKSIVELLIDKGADAFLKCRQRKTILHHSLRSSNYETFEFVFNSYGKELMNMTDSTDRLFFHAIMSVEGVLGMSLDENVFLERKNMLNLILKKIHKEQVIKQDKYGKTFLHCMAYFGDIKMIKTTLKKGGDEVLDKVDNYGKTPINEAALAGNIEAVILLLNEGAKFDHVTNAGETVMKTCESLLGKKKSLKFYLLL